MKCINHPHAEAAGCCQICGKALCATCVNRFNPPLCEQCLIHHNTAVARRLYLELGITALIFVGISAAMLFRNPSHIQGSLIMALMFACAYWGWQFLNRFSMPIAFTSGFGLILYLAFKLILSICFGLFVAPWQIFWRIREIVIINSLKRQIKQGNA